MITDAQIDAMIAEADRRWRQGETEDIWRCGRCRQLKDRHEFRGDRTMDDRPMCVDCREVLADG